MSKTTTAGYSISNEAYSMLQNHSEDRYGKDGIAGHVIVDAIRYNLETDDTDAFEKQQYNELDADTEGFSFVRGETKEVHFRIQEDLLEAFRNQARQVYSQRKIGKYLSRCVYVYVYERQKKAYESVDTVDDVVDELRGNYEGIDYMPDKGVQIPKSKKYTVPLLITILKQLDTDVYTEGLITLQGKNALTQYVNVTEKSISNYVDEVTNHMVEIANIWTGFVDIDMDEIHGFIFQDRENQEVQDYVDEWVDKIAEYIDGDTTLSVLKEIRESLKTNIERYEDTQIDTSEVEEIEQEIAERLDEGDYIL